jgi:prepilin-type processing-associated H-X9-DG protein
MADQIRCPHCGQTYELTPDQVPQYAGQTITCTSCQRAFTVPQMSGPAPTAPAATTAMPPGMQPGMPGGMPPHMQPRGPGASSPFNPPPAQQGKNGTAVAALVFSILGLTILPIIGAIVGIILGFIGLAKAKDPVPGGERGGRGLAIAALSVGFASFFLWGILGCMISILLPSLNRARETANRVKCASNLRQIGMAELLYSNENRGQLSLDFAGILVTQDITADKFVCPSSNDTPAPGGTPQQQAQVLHQHCSYVYIPGQTNAASAEAVVAYEPLTNHDGDGANFLFGDGHVSWESEPTAAAMIRSLEAGQNPPATR